MTQPDKSVGTEPHSLRQHRASGKGRKSRYEQIVADLLRWIVARTDQMEGRDRSVPSRPQRGRLHRVPGGSTGGGRRSVDAGGRSTRHHARPW